MDDFTDGFAAGWGSALLAAHDYCVRVWLPGGEFGFAVPQGELVKIRQALIGKEQSHG